MANSNRMMVFGKGWAPEKREKASFVVFGGGECVHLSDCK